MENNQTPPQIPPQMPPPIQFRQKMSFTTKIIYLGIQCGLLMLGVFVMYAISFSRDERNTEVAEQIADEWGKAAHISGPFAKEHLDSAASCRPQRFNCEAFVDTKSLHRNIYEAEVYSARVSMNGTFDKDSIAALGDTLYIQLNVTTRQLAKLSPLNIGGKTVAWNKGRQSLFAKVDIKDMPRAIEFATDFTIRGSESLFIKQIGDDSSVTIDGEAPNPSFRGVSLPDKRLIRGRRFKASWETNLVPEGVTFEDDFGYVGANFLVGVDRYQMVVRSLKYSFLIILLTYISVLFAEIMMKRDIPLINYFLIGAALIIFYTLLLSFSEHLSFGIAYLSASAMTILLIAGYMWKMLGSRKVGLVIGMILTVLYLFCYILLSLDTYALLVGSLTLFIALAAMMYGSLKIRRAA